MPCSKLISALCFSFFLNLFINETGLKNKDKRKRISQKENIKKDIKDGTCVTKGTLHTSSNSDFGLELTQVTIFLLNNFIVL